jgi:hypothetical protein
VQCRKLLFQIYIITFDQCSTAPHLLPGVILAGSILGLELLLPARELTAELGGRLGSELAELSRLAGTVCTGSSPASCRPGR